MYKKIRIKILDGQISRLIHKRYRSRAYIVRTSQCLHCHVILRDVERRLLDRKRQKFGVSEDRAKLIEESCKPSLSDEEKEYIEIYRDMLEDGEISERRRKMLKREAESLGIADSRAFELESMI